MAFVAQAEEYISRLEDQAGENLFDPRNYTFNQNLDYLEQLIAQSKEKLTQKQFDKAYVGFRRFQIVLSHFQRYNFFGNDTDQINKYNNVTY